MLFMSCVFHAFASAHCCLVVTCWERADLLAFVIFNCSFFSLPHVVSCVRCGTRLYRFLIFAAFHTLADETNVGVYDKAVQAGLLKAMR